MIEGQFKPYQRLQLEPLEQLVVDDIPLTIAFQTSAHSVASTVTWPTIAAGDLAVLLDRAVNSSGVPSNVVPTGFTQAGSPLAYSGGIIRTNLNYKILDGSESGSLTGMDGSFNEFKILTIFRPNRTINSVTIAGAALQWTDGNPAAQVCSANGQATPLLLFGAATSQGTSAAFSTASPSFDSTITTSDGRGIKGYKVYNSSPADHTIDMNDLGGNNVLSSWYMLLT